MQESTRKLTARELRELNGYVSFTTYLFGVFLLSIAAIFFGMLFIVANEATKLLIGVTWWPVATLGALVFIYFYAKRWTGGREKKNAVKEDIKKGLAALSIFDVRRVLRFFETEDEGNTFIIEDADGNAYYFGGQELPRAFPKETVVLPHAPLSSIQLPIRMSGDRITPIDATISFGESYLSRGDDGGFLNRPMAERLDEPFQAILDKTPQE